MIQLENKTASKNQQDCLVLRAGNAVKVAMKPHPSRIYVIYIRHNYKLRKTGQIT
jgi:hypothetical protein